MNKRSPENITPIVPNIRSIEKDPLYVPMYDSAATSHLGALDTQKTPPIRDEVTGAATIQKGALTVTIKDYLEGKIKKDLRPSTHKLLDLCTLEFTRQTDYKGEVKNYSVIIPIERYMELLKIPNTKASKDKARRTITEDLQTLYDISINWKGKGKTPDHLDARICTSKGIIRGNIMLSFSPEMAKYLTEAYITQYPVELLALDGRNPTSFYVGRKLAYHHSMRNNQKRGTADIISLNSLIEACPTIPSYEEVMEKGRQLDQLILQPLTNALNSLPFIEKWEFCNAKKVPLTETQLTGPVTLDLLNSLYLHFTLKSSPTIGEQIDKQ